MTRQKPIAIDGAGPDGSAEVRWRFFKNIPCTYHEVKQRKPTIKSQLSQLIGWSLPAN